MTADRCQGCGAQPGQVVILPRRKRVRSKPVEVFARLELIEWADYGEHHVCQRCREEIVFANGRLREQ
jgi:hypothetical protein